MPGQRGGGAGGGASLYYEIANFQAGMDLRKSALTAPAGTLRMLQNGDITQGGEIEKRPAFQFWCTAPPGSIGVCTDNNGNVYTHLPGDVAGAITPPTDTSIGVIGIVGPGGGTSTQVTLQIQGTISQTTFTANVVTGGSLIVGSTLQGPTVTPGTVINAFGSGAGGAGTYTVNISQLSSPTSASGVTTPGSTVVLQSQLSYDVFNGQIYAVFQGSNGHVYHYYNGVGVAGAIDKGTKIRTYKEKIYGVQGRNLYFSAVGDPTTWQDPPPDSSGNVAHNGSGFINIGANDADSEDLRSMEVYYDKMAIFSALSCQLWFLDPDPSLNQYYQTLRDAGTLSPNSVRQYVANDVYFLGTHGIRSLRARDLTTTAAVADVGSPIDPVIQDLIDTREASGGMAWTTALLSPRTGRIWLVMYDQIYILSNWASPNISAWSVYIPEFTIDNGGAVFADPYVVLRATDGRIFRFGSTGGLVYDDCPVSFTTPFLSFDKPATFKFYQGFDAICSNDPGSTWNVQASFDPTQATTPFDQICVLDGSTIMDGRIPISGRGTHIQLQITHQAPGPATFSKLFIHYAPAETS
jgi:hypothetical protein